MACIVVIYDGSDPEELKLFEQICSEPDPERGEGAFKRLSPTTYWLYSLNVSEIKVAKLAKAITKGKWYCVRAEDDEFTTGGESKRLSW